MSLTDAELAQFREALLEERRATLQLMESLGADIRAIVDARADSNNDDEHDPEGSTIAFERSQSDALLTQSRHRLADNDAALKRLDEGTYGTCVECARPIAPARLEARPSAALCIECASRR